MDCGLIIVKSKVFFRKIFYERKPDCGLISTKFEDFFTKCLGFAPILAAGNVARSGARARPCFRIIEIEIQPQMQTYVCFIQTPRPIANKIWINQTNIKITPKLQQQSEHQRMQIRISAMWKATTDVLQMDPVNSDPAAPPSERLVVLYPKDANAQRERTWAQYRGGAGIIFSRMSDNFNSTTLQCNAVSTPHKQPSPPSSQTESNP
jgi:hypothetical protein